MNVEAPDLTEDIVIQGGEWDARYARVVLIVQDRDVAMSLVDANGDGAELANSAWSRDESGWHEGCSSGGPAGGILGSALNQGAGWCVHGIVQPGASAQVQLEGTTYECRANDLGYWGFVRWTEYLDETPVVVAGIPSAD